jgi:hypothetical protein
MEPLSRLVVESMVALRDEPGSGSVSRDGMILSWAAAGEQDTEPVVGQAAEASPGTLDLFDGEVGGFDAAVGGSGGVVGEDLGPPAGQGLGEGAQLRARHRIGAPSDRSIERCLGGVVVIAEVDVADVLLSQAS